MPASLELLHSCLGATGLLVAGAPGSLEAGRATKRLTKPPHNSPVLRQSGCTAALGVRRLGAAFVCILIDQAVVTSNPKLNPNGRT